jgi:23S rRNA (guanosine2251-2'-O)-methyltransferase
MPPNENIVFGTNPVLEKLKASASEVVEILIAESARSAALSSIVGLAEQHRVRLMRVQGKTLDRLTGGYRHQGVVARVNAYRYHTFDDLLTELGTPAAPNWILVLDGITDPRNFGALLRSAEAVSLRHIVIAKDRSAEVTPVVVKASAGASHHLNIYQVTNLRRAIAALKKAGYWAVGLDGQSPHSIYDKVLPQRLVVVLGAEGSGLRPITLRECDFVLSIPMLGKVASLNVAVAGAVFFYELVRQRGYS